ncbi:hypothetical protein [Priestia filamentosa]|uniref:hypothetical protein n=1 Tax=Priestia filamentosa TaxID=1402861 RepID=UPI000A090EAB|nr:hypothetical protein [Priestia filamentosa]OXS67245.1 hypothetical protein B1B01_17285 [Priestia filamentosa]SMF53617.1 hypothetical protein SAMN06296056_104250 [Priestia filamentosa]
MFNYFSVPINEFQFILEQMGKEILINDETRKVLLTNKTFRNEFEQYTLHSAIPFKRGDHIQYADNHYLVVSDTPTQCNNKYKGLIQHCNYQFEIEYQEEGTQVCERVQTGTKWNGEPIYETVCTGEPGQTVYRYIPMIIENRSYTVNDGAITTLDKQMTMTVQDNEENRTKWGAVESELMLHEETYRVINIDKTQTGLLILGLEKTVTATTTA